MSTENDVSVNTIPFITLESFKSEIGIEDDGQDDQILPVIVRANRRMSLTVFPVLDKRDPTGSPLFQDMKDTAAIYCRALYEKNVINQEERYKSYKEEYESSVKILIAAIKAQPIDLSTKSVIAFATSSTKHSLLNSINRVTDKEGQYIRDNPF